MQFLSSENFGDCDLNEAFKFIDHQVYYKSNLFDSTQNLKNTNRLDPLEIFCSWIVPMMRDLLEESTEDEE